MRKSRCRKQVSERMFERKDIILETERLYLREMNQGDFHSLCKILQDDDSMYAYEGAFSDEEVQEWHDCKRQLGEALQRCRHAA